MEKIICVIDCGTIWAEKIKNNIEKYDYLVEVMSLNNFDDSQLKKYSGIVISGANILLTEVDSNDYIEKFKFLLTNKIPVLGICFGHQVMGMVYGASIEIKNRIDKMEKLEIFNDSNLLSDIKDSCVFREEHSEYISLPKQFELLAKSESCKNEVMKHKNKNLYGVQFHPEVSSECGRMIFKNFLKKIC